MADIAVTPTTVLHGGASLLGALVVYFGPTLGPWIAVLVAALFDEQLSQLYAEAG